MGEEGFRRMLLWESTLGHMSSGVPNTQTRTTIIYATCTPFIVTTRHLPTTEQRTFQVSGKEVNREERKAGGRVGDGSKDILE